MLKEAQVESKGRATEIQEVEITASVSRFVVQRLQTNKSKKNKYKKNGFDEN